MLKSCMKGLTLFALDKSLLPALKKFKYYSLTSILLLLIGCGEDSPQTKGTEKESNSTTNVKEDSTELKSTLSSKLGFPKVSVEELDHSQEFFKEQHTTSFSYVPRKNWTSFTASKNGLLTKILLFGKANLIDSPHYGLSMSGFVRENNPDSGPKFGRWSLSRDEIVSQLAAQGLGERESGWLTIRIMGEVPQNIGTRYFLVCDKITENKSWFGEFAFGEANPYEFGSHWLNKEHDLVMRTYVGKTDEQIKALQIDSTQIKANGRDKESLPVPISQSPQESIIVAPPIISPQTPSVTQTEIESAKKPDLMDENKSSSTDNKNEDQNRSQKKSMFDRLFKKDKRD